MTETLVIADASCLILLQKIGALPLMQRLFQCVLITPEVAREVRFSVPNWVEVVPVANPQQQKTLELTLDVGEASSIALYFEQPGALLVIDERKGRAVARRLNLNFCGTLRLLAEAKRRGLIPSVRELLDQIDTTDFRLTETLKATILRDAGE